MTEAEGDGQGAGVSSDTWLKLVWGGWAHAGGTAALTGLGEKKGGAGRTQAEGGYLDRAGGTENRSRDSLLAAPGGVRAPH